MIWALELAKRAWSLLIPTLTTLMLGSDATFAVPIDSTTLLHKMILGYQGWFACPGDVANVGWSHWIRSGAATVEMLPDEAELASDERCVTPWRWKSGEAIAVFSTQNPKTVDRHFKWMADYGLDGVALQRFASQLRGRASQAAVDRVLTNVRAAAEAHGRVFFVMYDLSGLQPEELPLIQRDWQRIMLEGVTASSAYLRHRGHPLVGLWGLGFAGRPIDPENARILLQVLRGQSPGGITIVGGVPAYWRQLKNDADTDPKWTTVYQALDVISPWTVGRYVDLTGVDTYRATLAGDLERSKSFGIDYMPVVFPGFSWHNLMMANGQPTKAIFNSIPRQCGKFYWRQVYNATNVGITMLYNAMFDEVDEGTAMFKVVPTHVGLPERPAFVTLDADGCQLPSDWYLRLAGAATRSLSISERLPKEMPTPPMKK